jgi:hypothetical protein
MRLREPNICFLVGFSLVQVANDLLQELISLSPCDKLPRTRTDEKLHFGGGIW